MPHLPFAQPGETSSKRVGVPTVRFALTQPKTGQSGADLGAHSDGLHPLHPGQFTPHHDGDHVGARGA